MFTTLHTCIYVIFINLISILHILVLFTFQLVSPVFVTVNEDGSVQNKQILGVAVSLR
jgi:hypothetical protein